MSPSQGVLWIITAPRGAGKTRFCSRLAAAAQQKDLAVKGIVCPPEFNGTEKTAIHAIDLSSGRQTLLASAKKREGVCGTVTDHWDFNEEAMKWSNNLLGTITDADLAIIDELGPLEFQYGKGWQNGIKLLDQGGFRCAVVVIRPDLLTTAQQRWPSAKVMEIPAGLDQAEEEKLQWEILQDLIQSVS